MNKSKWLIDNYLIETSYHDALDGILKKMGYEVIVDKYIPFSQKPENYHYSDDDCVVMYGSIGFVNLYSKGRNFIPGAYYQEKALETLSYVTNIDKNEMLANQDYVFTTFKDFVRRKDFFYGIFNSNKVFIRPNSGFKTFTGLPIHYDEFDYEINTLKSLTSVVDDTLILVSSCKKISAEYRFFICNREVVAGSQYKKDEELFISKNYSESAFEVAKMMTKNLWQPDLAYACDVGIINGEPKIIELNAFSCSGFYACNIEDIIDSVNRIAIMEFNNEISIGE